MSDKYTPEYLRRQAENLERLSKEMREMTDTVWMDIGTKYWIHKFSDEVDRILTEGDSPSYRRILDQLQTGCVDRTGEVERAMMRLAAYEAATIVRDESVPDSAMAWWKTRGACWWIGAARQYSKAPDLRPNIEGPITLTIVDLDTP